MAYSYSAVEKQLCSIAIADWDDQYITEGGIVKDRCFIGRLLKILGLTKIDWVRNVLFSSNLSNSSLKVKELLVASQNEKSALSDKVKAALHLKVQKQFNQLLYRYSAKATESNHLSTAYIDLDKLFAKLQPLKNVVIEDPAPEATIYSPEEDAGSAPPLPLQIDNDEAENAQMPFDKLQWPARLHSPLTNPKEYLKVFPSLIDAAKADTLPALVGDDQIRLHALVCLSNMGPKHPLSKNLAKTQKDKVEALATIQKSIKTLSLFQQCLLVDIAESKRVTTNAGTRKKLLDNLLANYHAKLTADNNSAECAQLKQCLKDQKEIAKQEKNTLSKVFFKSLYTSIKDTASLQA